MLSTSFSMMLCWVTDYNCNWSLIKSSTSLSNECIWIIEFFIWITFFQWIIIRHIPYAQWHATLCILHIASIDKIILGSTESVQKFYNGLVYVEFVSYIERNESIYLLTKFIDAAKSISFFPVYYMSMRNVRSCLDISSNIDFFLSCLLCVYSKCSNLSRYNQLYRFPSFLFIICLFEMFELV